VSGEDRPRRLRTDLPVDDAVRLLTEGTLRLEGRLGGASNVTLRAFVTLDDVSARCVYKPVRGERPLWDFPDGTLAAREVAAYLVSQSTGWGIVPPTVLRDGPLGPGACQLWVTSPKAAPPRVGFVAAHELPEGWQVIGSYADEDDGTEYLLGHADDPQLARIALFDVVVNNADRKGGHVLTAPDRSLRGIDHGVSFHTEDKLRTILWGFMGRAVSEADVSSLVTLRSALAPGGALREELCELLAAEEIEATMARLDRLLRAGVFPSPRSGRPAIPWPPV
jgi:uncharacterized repeat protein (TIGR03843 family)